MPQINLLKSTPKKKTVTIASVKDIRTEFIQISFLLLIRSAIGAGLCFAVWIVLFINMTVKEKAFHKLEDKVKVLLANPKEIERLRNERSILEKKVKLIDSLSSRRFFWYEKLETISSLIPSGVWLTDLHSKVEKITNPSQNSQASSFGEKTTLVISGTTVAYKIQDAVSLIGDFINNLQADKNFSADFPEIKLNTATKGTIGNLDVMRFDFLCETK